jgi:hypothetical protein
MPVYIQRFVGDKPVDSFPPEAIRQIPDEELRKREVGRLSKGEHKEPGAGRRAGAATRNPDGAGICNFLLRGVYESRVLNTSCFTDYDTKGRGGQGNTVPMAGAIHAFDKSEVKISTSVSRSCYLNLYRLRAFNIISIAFWFLLVYPVIMYYSNFYSVSN